MEERSSLGNPGVFEKMFQSSSIVVDRFRFVKDASSMGHWPDSAYQNGHSSLAIVIPWTHGLQFYASIGFTCSSTRWKSCCFCRAPITLKFPHA
ncbi:conserved hypothetical protein [Ricinus communis]|uniref:Uncharacterized protein n=1 Tax=Ricinus communis TaxID=3988 RepID=B9R6X7_RICCO|nr:conserved hypothetical protein [Ricinus communis]